MPPGDETDGDFPGTGGGEDSVVNPQDGRKKQEQVVAIESFIKHFYQIMQSS